MLGFSPMGATWQHRLTSADADTGTGVCAVCGPVELGYRNQNGKRVVRCGVAQREQRYSPNRDRMRHGLTSREARDMRSGKYCIICGSTDRLAIDHCHISNSIRGVLCRKCNLGLGSFDDSIERLKNAIAYLEKHCQ